MADGALRFNHTGAGSFSQYNQFNNTRIPNRANSPHGNRRPLNHDTPSPTRSPPASNMSHNFNNMFNPNGYHGSQGVMNGGQNHSRYGMQPKFQQNHNLQNQLNHQQNHHNTSHYGHQQNQLSSGFVSQQHPSNYAHDQQNGHLEGLQHDELDYDGGPEWRQQRQLAIEIKRASSPNHTARQSVKDKPNSRAHPFGPQGQTTDSQPDRESKGPIISEAPCKWTELDLGGQAIRCLNSTLFRYGFLKKLYLAHNNISHLPEEISMLRSLKHLDVSYNQLTELPEDIGLLSALETLYAFGNQIQNLPWGMGYLYKLKMLGILGNPLDEDIEGRIRDENTTGLIRYLRENMPDPQPPEERAWLDLEDSAALAESEKLRTLTYNILADGNVIRTSFDYVSDRVIDWQYRRPIILEEITHADADFVCLQELDRESYDDYFRPNLSKCGYQSFYGQRSRADTLGDKAKSVDGCGTFWKTEKYIALDKQLLVLGREAVKRRSTRSADLINRVFMRDHIATVVLLENRITGTRFIVVNTHLLWDPAYKDVKLIQTAVLMEELTRLAGDFAKAAPCLNKKAYSFTNADGDSSTPAAQEPGPSQSYESGNQIPMIICGDFNSGFDSPVYQLMTQRKLEAGHADLVGYEYEYTKNGMEHPFTLKSAYGDSKETVKQYIEFTNYTPIFKDVLDYIWYSSNTMRPIGLLGKVDEDYVKKVPGFPNAHFPSDHLALLAEFVVPRKSTSSKN